LGENHPDTLKSMNNLAIVFWGQKRSVEATLLEVQVVEIRRRALGAEHTDTLKSMSTLRRHTVIRRGRKRLRKYMQKSWK